LSGKLAVIYSDDFLAYDFGPAHPLTPKRLKLTYLLMKATGILSKPGVEVQPPRMANEHELSLFHEKDYLDFVRRMSKTGHGLLDFGDTPAFRGAYEAAAVAVGATLVAADLIMEGSSNHAMNISGGLHHAHPERASGFCIFNDPAICIAYLKQRYNLKRILYLDIDAHHGDGVMYGYYSDPSLLDIDFHEDGKYLFPGSGFIYETGECQAKGLKVNVPIPPLTGDHDYIFAFQELVPPLIHGFKPEFIIAQFGADSHRSDPLAHLQLTTLSYSIIARSIHELAHEVCQGRVIALGGGGYIPANVARAWTIVAAELAGINLKDTLPEEWKMHFKKLMGIEAPERLRTEEPFKIARLHRTAAINSITADLKRRIPLLSHLPS